jgi:hypothetical protein
VKQIVHRKVAILLAAILVLVAMMFFMSPGFALPTQAAGKAEAKAGGKVPELPPEAKAGDVV